MCKHTLIEEGYKEIPWREYIELPNGNEYRKKDRYIGNYLLPAIIHANCGWENIKYKIFESKTGSHEEYIVLCYDNHSDEGRYINVSGNSLAAIAQAVSDNIF